MASVTGTLSGCVSKGTTVSDGLWHRAMNISSDLYTNMTVFRWPLGVLQPKIEDAGTWFTLDLSVVDDKSEVLPFESV